MVIIEEVYDDMSVPNRELVVSENFRGRVLDQKGVALVRAGQTIDTGLLDAVKASYANLVYHPFALFFAILGSFILLAESFGTVGPLELMAQQFHKTAAANSHSTIRSFMTILLIPLETLIQYKIRVAIVSLVLVPYVCKPSRSNLYITMVLLLTALIADYTVLEVFVFANLFYLFVMIRSPSYRLLLVIIFTVVAFGVFEIEKMLEVLRETHKKLNVKIPQNVVKAAISVPKTTPGPITNMFTTTTDHPTTL